MIRRAVLVTAAAVALILSPTAAMAYNAANFNVTVTDSTPTTGVPFTLNVTGAEANEAVTLTTCSTPSVTKNANASGEVSFTITLTEAGSCTLTLTNAAGETLGTQTVMVSDAGVVAGVVADQLANTGSDGRGLAVGGGALVLAGAGAVFVARRRKSAKVPA